MEQYHENRFSKIDDAIQRLASVSADLSKMMAVQDQRLMHQERISEKTGAQIERNKDIFETRVKEIQTTVKEEVENLNCEIKKSRDKATEQHLALDQRVSKIEKLLLIGTGMVTAIGTIIAILEKYLNIL